MSKVKTKEQLLGLCKKLKSFKKVIVTTNGVFDILHIGHIKSLQKAREFGDVLIVGINSDASVKAIKGPNRPIIPQQERAEIIAALGCVDYVYIFDELNPSQLLAAIKPNIHIKGKDWENKECPEKALVEKNGGQMKFIELEKGFSTTDIIEKIKKT